MTPDKEHFETFIKCFWKIVWKRKCEVTLKNSYDDKNYNDHNITSENTLSSCCEQSSDQYYFQRHGRAESSWLEPPRGSQNLPMHDALSERGFAGDGWDRFVFWPCQRLASGGIPTTLNRMMCR
jgi:hypothetical protein